MPWRVRFDIIPNWFATDWMHYVGVVQDVYLEASPPTHIVRADALPRDTRGDVDVAVVVENDGIETRPLTAQLRVYELDADSPDYLTDPVATDLLGDEAAVSGQTSRTFALPAGKHGRLDFALRIENPRLWTPAGPNLYALVVELRDGQTLVDSFATQFGVRTVEIGANAKVLLNRRPAFFTGMARHEDWPDSGRTATIDKIARDLQIIRDTNVWFLRSAHYPNHPATYLLTDRLGFAVWQEIPAWWINMFTIPVLLERGLAMQMWREMIWNSRNRPSVLFWSLCNEPMWYLVFNLRQYVQALHADLDDNYPDGRLVTQSLAADGAVFTADAQQDVDVAGWTMYFGVFYGEDITAETLDFLQRQHDRFPGQPLLACEYGYWSGDNDAEAARQVEVADLTLDAFEQLAAVDPQGQTTDGPLCAATWWCQFNWYRVSEEGHTQSMGLMHMDRETEKPVHQTVTDRYQPYFAMGGLGPSVDPPDDDDNDNDDNDDASPPAADDDQAAPATGDDDSEGCGC
jgi:beta-glucuronidase